MNNKNTDHPPEQKYQPPTLDPESPSSQQNSRWAKTCGLLVAPPARFSRTPALWLLVWITISGTFPTHVFVPALPYAAKALHASSSSIQLTVTLYLIGIAIGQLIYGPLSDWFGRRPVLLCGLALFAVGSIGSALAPSVEVLIATRILQALGGCAGMVLGRAITRDSVASTQIVKRLAMLSLVMTLGPALAPTIGAQFTMHFGWRAIFVFLSISSSLVFAITLFSLPETHVDRTSPRAGTVVRGYLLLLRSRSFLGYAIGGACATTSFYSFLAVSPFILINQLGVPLHHFGLLYLGLFFGLALGSLAAHRMAGRKPESLILGIASAILALAPLLLLTAYLCHAVSVVTIMAPMSILMIGAGMVSPFSMSGALNAEPHQAGSASGMYGFLQMTFAACCSTAAGIFETQPLLSVIAILLASALAVWLCFRAISKKG